MLSVTTVDVTVVVVASGTAVDVVVVSSENSVGFVDGKVEGSNVGEADGGFVTFEIDGVTLGSLDCAMDGLNVGNVLGVVDAISAFVVVVVVVKMVVVAASKRSWEQCTR